MPASAARAATAESIEFDDVLSDDGTRLRAWTNDPDGLLVGPTVVLCNGLGTGPHAWPALLRPECGIRVVSWNHRGTGGSDRPIDPNRVGIEEFVEDALSVMDHFGVDRGVLMGWSAGVNTMFELAVLHPERVAGLFAVAGVPGDTFATMLGPLRLPHAAARALTVNLSRVLRYGGRALTPVTARLPIGPRAVNFLTHTGFMLPVPTRSWPLSRSRSSSRPRSTGTSTWHCTPPGTPGCRCAASRCRPRSWPPRSTSWPARGT